MVRHLEHLDLEARQLSAERCLTGRLEIAGEQDPDAAHLREQHHAGVVGRAAVARAGTWLVTMRPHRLEHHVTDPLGADLRRRPGHAGRGEGVVHGLDRLGRVEQRGGPHLSHTTSGEQSGQAIDMVGVEVGENQQRHLGDLQPLEAALEQVGVGADVHDDAGAGSGPKHERVALTDVAHRHHPGIARPAPFRDQPRHPDHRDDEQRQHHEHRRSALREQTRPDHREPDAEKRQHGKPQHAGAPTDGRQRHVRTRARDCGDPAHAPAGSGAEHRTQWRQHQANESGGQAEHSGRADDRRHQQVRQHRDQAHLAGQRRDDGGAGQLGCGGDRDRLGQPARHPPCHRVAPGWRQQHDAGGGQHRQGEPGRGRQARLDQQQDHGRDTQPAQRPLLPVAAERDHPDRAHGSRAQHARLGAREQHEADDPGSRDEHEPATAHPAPARQHEQEPDDQREVGAAHSSQMSQTGDAEVLLQSGVEGRVIPVDQRRHQRRLVGWPMSHGLPDRRAHRSGAPPPHVRVAHHLG